MADATTPVPNLIPQQDPTSALTFGDLLLEVAREMGVANYGVNGDEIAQIPINAHDLDECKRHVNNGLRMFFSDAPPTGWRFARPVMEIPLWSAVNVSTTGVTSSAVTDSGRTVVTTTSSTFFPSMELHVLTVTDVGDVLITKYLDNTRVEVDLNGNAVWSAKTFSLAATGNFTMPRFFAGIVTGGITYVEDTNQGIPMVWTNEFVIRQWRENVTDETGDPYWAAVRMMDVDGLGNPVRGRRWEIMFYPRPDEDMIVEFPIEMWFDQLTDESESPPFPFIHDECLKEACLAVVERDVYDKTGRHWDNYHQKALPHSVLLDARSGPRRLGYFGNPSRGPIRSIAAFRGYYYDRPTVSFNS